MSLKPRVKVLLAGWAIWGTKFGETPQIPFLDFLKQAKAAGWGNVNIGLFQGGLKPSELDDPGWDNLLARCADTGMKFQLTPWMWDGDKAIGANPTGWLSQLRAAIPMVKKFARMGLLVTVPGQALALRTDTGAAFEKGETWDDFRTTADQIAPTLREGAKLVHDEVGMTLTCEPEHRFRCFSSPRRIEYMFDAVDSPHFGMTTDSAHVQHVCVWGNGNPESGELSPNMAIATRRLLPLTRDFHLGDTHNEEVKAGGHIVTAPHLLLGDGKVDLDAFVRVAVHGGMRVVTVDHCMMDVPTLMGRLKQQREFTAKLFGPYADVDFGAA